MGEQEDAYAHALDDSRAYLKAIRNTEKSVQPSRENKDKIADEIQKLKLKEPGSTRLPVLEQELVRAEAENLVAEAQLTNIVSCDLHRVINHLSKTDRSCRPDKSSKKPMLPSSLPPSNVPKSRSY
jgi:hypothetical protein